MATARLHHLSLAIVLLIGTFGIVVSEKLKSGGGGGKGVGGPYDVLVEDHKLHHTKVSGGNFTLIKDGINCLKARFIMSFDVEYLANNPINKEDYLEMKKGYMPQSAHELIVDGRCMNSTDTPWLSVSWKHGVYKLNFTFHKHTDVSGYTWDIQHVELEYSMKMNEDFPNVARQTDRITKHAEYNGHLFSTPLGMSYECTGAVTTLTLHNREDQYFVYIYLSDMQFQPAQVFGSNFAPARRCSADLAPEVQVYSPHLHFAMGLVLCFSVISCGGLYHAYASLKTKGGMFATQLASFRADPLGFLKSGGSPLVAKTDGYDYYE